MLPYERLQAEFFDSIVHLPECEAQVIGGPSPDPPVALEGLSTSKVVRRFRSFTN